MRKQRSPTHTFTHKHTGRHFWSRSSIKWVIYLSHLANATTMGNRITRDNHEKLLFSVVGGLSSTTMILLGPFFRGRIRTTRQLAAFIDWLNAISRISFNLLQSLRNQQHSFVHFRLSITATSRSDRPNRFWVIRLRRIIVPGVRLV